MGIPSGWHYDTPGGGWESEWNDAQSRGPVGSGDGVTYYRSANGSEFALDYQSDTTVAGWGSRGIPPQYQSLLASAGDRQRGLLHGRNIWSPPPAPAPSAPAAAVPTPPPSPKMEATNPSLAEALQMQGRPGLRDALDSALRMDYWKQAGSDSASSSANGSTTADAAAGGAHQTEDAARRYAASDRWRKRLADVSQRLEKPLG